MKRVPFFLVLFLLSIVAGQPVSADEVQFHILFSNCYDVSAQDAERFVTDVNQYLSVSKMSMMLSCGEKGELVSNQRFLVVEAVQEENVLYFDVRLPEGAPGEAVQKRRREIPWGTVPASLVGETVSENKSKTFALLLDNIALDFVGIRLVSGDAAETTFEESEGTGEIVSVKDTQEVPEKILGQPIGTSRPTSCNCDTVCEMREEVIIRELAQEETCAVQKPATAKKFSPTTEVGVAAGLSLFSSWYNAPRISLYAASQMKRVMLAAWLSLETDSSFEIESRPFDTMAGVLAFGPRFRWRRHRIVLGVEPMVVFRYVSLNRADLANAEQYRFVDMGAGVYPFFQFRFHKNWGIMARVGVEMYPKARHVVIEDGPRRRLGFWSFPFQAAFFATF